MVQNFLMQLNQATSWSSPEILAIGKEKVMEYLQLFANQFKKIQEERNIGNVLRLIYGIFPKNQRLLRCC